MKNKQGNLTKRIDAIRKAFFIIALLLSISITKATIVQNSKNSANIVYVAPDSVGTGDGSSWANATNDLQAAINKYDTAEVWVAAGTYVPKGFPKVSIQFNQIYDSARYQALYMKNNIRIYGGFIGTESSLNERNWETNITKLSGDIGVLGDSSDNVFHIIYNDKLDTTAVLDGFLITNGFCNNDQLGGAGMLNVDASPSIVNCNFTKNITSVSQSIVDGGALRYTGDAYIKINNCQFNENYAKGNGGAINVTKIMKPSIITNCKFDKNTADNGHGGALYCMGDSILITNCEFTSNRANGEYNTTGKGGALYNNALALVDRCTFKGNEAAVSGGAVANKGEKGTYFSCLFAGNSSKGSAGIYFENPTIRVIVMNCTFVDNMGRSITGEKTGTYDINLSVSNSIFWGNMHTNANSQTANDIIGVEVSGGANNLVGYSAFDPLFADSAFHLQVGSPCRDKGSDYEYEQARGKSLDLDGKPRIIGTRIDMGAYEREPLRASSDGIVYVRADASPLGNGESWENATNDLKQATESFDTVQVWIAKGTYYPILPNILSVSVDSAKLRLEHFTLKNNVAWHGGFVGNEPTDYNLAERDLIANETILSGNINNKDNSKDNCYHVIYTRYYKLDSTVIIEGITIADGRASYESSLQDEELTYGGGIFLQNSFEIQIINCTFRNNYAYDSGAAIYMKGATCKISDCTFEYNETGESWGGGGAVYSTFNFTITNCDFNNNLTSGIKIDGGGEQLIEWCTFNSNSDHGIHVETNDRWGGPAPKIANCIFDRNTLSGIHNMKSSPKITNCVFTRNKNHGISSHLGFPIITNCTFTANKVDGDFYGVKKPGSGLNLHYYGEKDDTYFGNPVVRNCIVWGNKLYSPNMDSISNNCIQGNPIPGNFNTDPFFISTDSADFNLGLQANSPVINKGNNAYFDSTYCKPFDILGNARKSGVIDIGAYEFIQDYYTVTFELTSDSVLVTDATITFSGNALAMGDYSIEDVKAGAHNYTINKEGFEPINGELIVSADTIIMLNLTALNEETPSYNVTFVINNANTIVSDAIITFNGIESAMGDYVIENVAPGTYSYMIKKDGFGQLTGEVNVLDADITEIVMLVGVSISENNKINFYPNPFSNNITISNADKVSRIVISDRLGRKIKTIDNNGNSTLNINTTHLNSGIYFISLFDGDKLNHTVKISKP